MASTLVFLFVRPVLGLVNKNVAIGKIENAHLFARASSLAPRTSIERAPIEQIAIHQRRRLPLELGERGTAVAGLAHAVACRFEPIRHQLAHNGIVVDDQNIDRVCGSSVHFAISSSRDNV